MCVSRSDWCELHALGLCVYCTQNMFMETNMPILCTYMTYLQMPQWELYNPNICSHPPIVRLVYSLQSDHYLTCLVALHAEYAEYAFIVYATHHWAILTCANIGAQWAR